MAGAARDMEDAIAYEYLAQAIEDCKADGETSRTRHCSSTSRAGTRTRASRTSPTKRAAVPRLSRERASDAPPSTLSCANTSTRTRSRHRRPRFRQYLLERLATPGAPAITVAEIDEWLYGTGPAGDDACDPAAAYSTAVDRAAAEWRAGTLATDELPVKEWVPQEWVRFLDEQPADLADANSPSFARGSSLGADGNAVIARSWLPLSCVRL